MAGAGCEHSIVGTAYKYYEELSSGADVSAAVLDSQMRPRPTEHHKKATTWRKENYSCRQERSHIKARSFEQLKESQGKPGPIADARQEQACCQAPVNALCH
ncbi:hypothetical protein WJX75_007715 [Coccomyxa subellipsoidea]|uniref:Uncharacterized protein n=1 Tax=Coccomyxa subellipsoidea TaxID=248742 RepID=A0ABR2YQA8_9CHLO